MLSESVEVDGIQKDDNTDNENQQKLQIIPKRNRRVLIINEEIEIDLEENCDNELNDLQVSQPVQDQSDTCVTHEIEAKDCPEYDLVNPKKDDIEICEADVVSEIEDNKTRKINRIKVPEESTYRTLDYHLEEYLSRMFRKIAPKECPNNATATVNHENWRLSPPKKYKKKKNTLSALMETISERKIHLRKDRLIEQSKHKISKRSDQLILKKKKNLNCPIKSENRKKDSYLNSLVMEDIKEGELIIPVIAENEVPESSLNNQELINDMQLIICPYCRYKNPKEAIIRKHMILHHLETKQCIECCFYCTSWQTMALHMAKHNKNVSRCPFCYEVVKTPLVRNHIIAKHGKPILEKCRYCDFKIQNATFASQMRSLREHILSCHSKGKEDKYICPICGFTTSIDLEMKSHIYLNHSDLKRNVYRCVDCTFVAASITNLLDHVVVHQKKEKHVCVQCKFSISSQLWMNLHKKVHRVVLYKCPYCTFKRRENWLLKYHIQKRHKKDSFRAILKY